MLKGSRTIWALGATVGALVGLAGCGTARPPADAVVDVGGTPITSSTFRHWLAVAALSEVSGPLAINAAVPEPPEYRACIAHLEEIARKEHTHPTGLKMACEGQYKSLTKTTLNYLIYAQWVLSEARTLGVSVSDKQVKNQFETVEHRQFPRASEFATFLHHSGQTLSDALLRVKLNMLSARIKKTILAKSRRPSRAEIVGYYSAHASQYSTPEKRDVQILLASSQAAARSAMREIASGASFASVARRVSTELATRENGGVLNEVVKGEEQPRLDKAIFANRVGSLAGPVYSRVGYYVLRVTRVFPARSQSLDQAQASIRAQLVGELDQKALDSFGAAFTSRWKARTNCHAGYVVQDCSQHGAGGGA